MIVSRSIRHSASTAGTALGLATALSLCLSLPAAAQWRDDNGGYNGGYRNDRSAGRELFQWNGDVDREVQIVMRGDDIRTRDYGNNQYRWQRASLQSQLPQVNGEVQVRLVEGRGDAEVVQQPNARNGYTTIVRIRDPQSGAGRYRVAAYWQPYNNNGQMRRGDGDADDRGYYPQQTYPGGVWRGGVSPDPRRGGE